MSELERIKDTDPTGRMFIEPYQHSMNRFEKKLKRNYRFVVNPKKEKFMTEQAV